MSRRPVGSRGRVWSRPAQPRRRASAQRARRPPSGIRPVRNGRQPLDQLPERRHAPSVSARSSPRRTPLRCSCRPAHSATRMASGLRARVHQRLVQQERAVGDHRGFPCRSTDFSITSGLPSPSSMTLPAIVLDRFMDRQPRPRRRRQPSAQGPSSLVHGFGGLAGGARPRTTRWHPRPASAFAGSLADPVGGLGSALPRPRPGCRDRPTAEIRRAPSAQYSARRRSRARRRSASGRGSPASQLDTTRPRRLRAARGTGRTARFPRPLGQARPSAESPCGPRGRGSRIISANDRGSVQARSRGSSRNRSRDRSSNPPRPTASCTRPRAPAVASGELSSRGLQLACGGF